jgi:Replication-relaxation
VELNEEHDRIRSSTGPAIPERGGPPALLSTAPAGPNTGRAARLVLPTPRAIFVRESEWRSGTGLRLPAEEVRVLLRCLRQRDVCLLMMLAHHHYLTTDQVHALFFPSPRSAQARLRWLTDRRLLMRWRQLEPRSHGWRRRHSLYLLAERGAVVLARRLKADARALVKRSWFAAEFALQLGHDLEVTAFVIGLAVASRDLPDQGLYHWVGQDSLRRGYQEDGVDLAPDAWGRYLTPAGEITFALEWDRGTEAPRRLAAKARAYTTYFMERPGGGANHVLFVGPGRVRESSIRAAIASAASPGLRPVTFLTTHTELLHTHGPLGEVWLASGDDRRVRLGELEGWPRTGRRVADCLGKPGWWDRRPGAGEGA